MRKVLQWTRMRFLWVPRAAARRWPAAAARRAAGARVSSCRARSSAVAPERNEVVIKHEDIKGFMPGMTMPFKVKDAALLDGQGARRPGDGDAGRRRIERAPVDARRRPDTRRSTRRRRRRRRRASCSPASTVADALLVDQDGTPRPLSQLRGHRVALTFIYTRCPLPEFCPLMDRHFAAVQKTIASTPALADVRLLTMTLDPAFDTPAVLKPHAAGARGRPGDLDVPDRRARRRSRSSPTQFGIYVERDPQSADRHHPQPAHRRHRSPTAAS